MEQCRVTAIANQKGGVGKTVSTVNLGAALVHAGKRVLLVDADPQGSLTISLGMNQPDDLDTTITTVMQAVVEEKSIYDLDHNGKVAAAYENLTREVLNGGKQIRKHRSDFAR